MAVVLYHARLGVPGGYVGVDVFYVISGFLITSLILRDLEAGGFTLVRFWERRVRRILPAVVVVTLSTLVAGWAMLIPCDYGDLGESAVWQALFGANLYYWHHINYFQSATEVMPLLHTWSLAVEEQFYMVAPAALMVAFRYRWSRRRWGLAVVLGVALAASFVLSCLAVSRYPGGAFYLLPSRAWELLIGCVLAALPARRHVVGRLTGEVVAYLGFAAVLAACFMYDEKTPFPGSAAVLPCLGAAGVLWATGRRPGQDCPVSLGRWLARPPVVFVGLISYSLYLWHWPLLAFSRYVSLGALSVAWRVAILVAAGLLSVASWRYVETPVRRRRLCPTRRGVFACSAAGLALALVGGGVVFVAGGFPGRVTAEAQAYSAYRHDLATGQPIHATGALAGHLYALGQPDTSTAPELLVWGDSHAMAALPAFDALLKEEGVAGRMAMRIGTPPVLGHGASTDRRGEGIAYNQAAMEHVRGGQFSDVVLVGRWSYYGDPAQGGPGAAAFTDDLIETVRALRATGATPWVMLQVPEHPLDVPIALAKSVVWEEDVGLLCSRPSGWNGISGDDRGVLRRLEAAGARLIDPRPAFLDETGQHYAIAAAGAALYTDNHHLSATGARLVLLPVLRQSLAVGHRPPFRAEDAGATRGGTSSRGSQPAGPTAPAFAAQTVTEP